MKRAGYILLLAALLLAVPTLSGQSEGDAVTPSAVEQSGAGQEELNVSDLIFGHLRDSYSWHITTYKGRAVSIPLLCIVRSRQGGGWHIFSSSRIEEGRSYAGFHVTEDKRWPGKLVELDTGGNECRPIDISFTKNAAALVLNSLLMILLFLGVAGWYRRHDDLRAVPKGFVGAVEMLTMAVEDEVIKKSVGADYKRYSPYLLTAFYFILINNVMGLLPTFPGGANTTGNIAVTLVLALCTMVAINLFGNKEYWKEILWPNVPIWLKIPPIMPVIELFGIISKPFALTVRLFANIFAGHTIILALTCMVFITVKMGMAINAGMSAFAVLLSVFMLFLEMLVAFIQAYIFTMLSAVFIGQSRKHPEKEINHKPINN